MTYHESGESVEIDWSVFEPRAREAVWAAIKVWCDPDDFPLDDQKHLLEAVISGLRDTFDKSRSSASAPK